MTVDSNGNLTQVVDPDSATQQYSYSTPSNHRITSEVSPDGYTATVTYDSFGVVQSESLYGGTGTVGVAPAQEQGLIAAGGAGAMVVGSTATGTSTDANSHTTTYTFDGMYHPLTVTDGAGGTTTYTRDADTGWVTGVTDPDNRTTSYSYDPSTSTHDSNGEVATVTRNDGTSMTTVYGTDSQPTQGHRLLRPDHDLQALIQEGNVLRRTDPDGLHEDWTYNSAGQVLTDTDRNGNATDYSYDLLGRVTTITYPSTAVPLDVATGGMATSSATYSGHAAGAGFDGSLVTKWDATGNSNVHPRVPRLGAGGAWPYVLTQYAITAGDDTSTYTGRAPSSWWFQGYNGSSWVTLDTQTNVPDTVSFHTTYYRVTTPGAYTAYRLYITANNGATDGTQLEELQLLGVPYVQQPDAATGGTATSSATYSSTPPGARLRRLAGDEVGRRTGNSNVYLEYDFAGGASYVVTQYAITAGDDTSTYTGAGAE